MVIDTGTVPYGRRNGTYMAYIYIWHTYGIYMAEWHLYGGMAYIHKKSCSTCTGIVPVMKKFLYKKNLQSPSINKKKNQSILRRREEKIKYLYVILPSTGTVILSGQ
jgi:hypothetical protein